MSEYGRIPRCFYQTSLPCLAGCGILLLPAVRGWVGTSGTAYAAYLFTLSLLAAGFLVPPMMVLGTRLGMVDHPDEARKQHARATPLTGGVAIYLAFAATIFYNFEYSVEMKAILVAATIIFVVGLLDDWIGLSALVRLAVQVGASLLLIAFGVQVTFVPDWLGGVVVEAIITIVWIVGITNSMNFIDGMDGLAAGTSTICAGFFALVALITHQSYMMYLALAMAGSSLGFFFYNFRGRSPALVFMGDSGSTFLGFLLASFAILGEWGRSITDLVVPVLIMSVLIFDMSLTTIVRISTGEVKSFSQWIHFTGRDHFHHRLSALGLSRVKATMLYFLVTVSFALEALVILFSNVTVSLLVLMHSLMAFFIVGTILVSHNKGATSSGPSGKPTPG